MPSLADLAAERRPHGLRVLRAPLCSLCFSLAFFFFLQLSVLTLFPDPALAQETPVLRIEEDVRAFAFAPDGRIAYAVRRTMKTRQLELQRDDIYLVGPDRKPRRIVNGEKLIRGPAGGFFSYTVDGLRWSPDSTRLVAHLQTSVLTDARGETQEGQLALLLDETGKEIKIAGADSVIPEAQDATWLADGVTVAYLTEGVQPKLLFSLNTVRPVAGRGGIIFADRLFSAVAWDAKRNAAVAIERDRSLSGSPRLVLLDLLKETRRELATLENYLGGLTLSPSGGKVAYFIDPETLEIRDAVVPDRALRLRVAMGTFEWAADERRILLKRGSEKRSENLVWVSVPPLPTTASASPQLVEPPLELILHGLTFRDFALSPDGRSLAVLQPGNRNLLVYPLP